MFTFMNARHLLPGYLALLVLAALGIEYGWSRRAARLMRVTFAALTVFVAWVIVGNVTLYEAFRTITFPPEDAPPLDGTRLQFGDAEFMGYRLDPPVVRTATRQRDIACVRCHTTRCPSRMASPFTSSRTITRSMPGASRSPAWASTPSGSRGAPSVTASSYR
jgi:hypothetical protein